MRLFLNCSNLRFGGGKTVGFNIINYYIHKENIKLTVVAPVNCGYETFKRHNCKLILLPTYSTAAYAKPVVNYIILPLLAAFSRCNKIISLGNVAFPTFLPQILLIHLPHLVYPESLVWDKLDYNFKIYSKRMIRFIKINLRFADIYCLQTETMRKRFISQYKCDPVKVFILPNVVSYMSLINKSNFVKNDVGNDGTVNLLFLSKYYPHKNFEILFELIPLIIKKASNVRITLTISESEGDSACSFINRLTKIRNYSQIINLVGNIKMEDIHKIYDEHDGLFLPTLLESYSGTYIEAMYFNKPIFTSDLDFAHDVCNDAAFYFDPSDPENILNTIENAFANKMLISEKIEAGQKIVKNEPTWSDVGKILDGIIANMI